MRTLMSGLALATALMVGTAQAATLSFTGISTGSDISLGRFDTGRGTLTGAEFYGFGSASAISFATAAFGETAVATAFASATIKFADLEFSASDSETLSCTAPDNGSCSVAPLAQAFPDPYGLPNLGLVSGVGPGTVPVEVDFVGDPAFSYFELTVTYTYDPVTEVPLPAAGGLMAAGLGGLALLGRRRAG